MRIAEVVTRSSKSKCCEIIGRLFALNSEISSINLPSSLISHFPGEQEHPNARNKMISNSANLLPFTQQGRVPLEQFSSNFPLKGKFGFTIPMEGEPHFPHNPLFLSYLFPSSF